jgi:hypothetical protein
MLGVYLLLSICSHFPRSISSSVLGLIHPLLSLWMMNLRLNGISVGELVVSLGRGRLLVSADTHCLPAATKKLSCQPHHISRTYLLLAGTPES